MRVQPFFGFRNANQLLLNARAIQSDEPVFEKRSFWRGAGTMMGLYASHEVANLPVTLEYTGAGGTLVSQKVVSGPEGFVRFDLDLEAAGVPASDAPRRTRWEKAVLRWERPGTVKPDGEATAYILTPGTETQIGVISDIDDTILETGITGNIRAIARNWRRMVEMPSERILVPGANAFYAAIGGKPVAPREPATVHAPAPEHAPAHVPAHAPGFGPGIGPSIGPSIDSGINSNIAAPLPQSGAPEARVRPVFYVSSSPWNLFSYLVTFKRERGLPLGPVMLRDWGFNRKTLGKEGHGSHKREAIERILKTFPHLRFALIGDDTQKDLMAFGSIAAAFPGRIAAVFIRSASSEPLNDEQLHAKDVIDKAGVPFWSGSDYRAAEEFLQSAGLDLEGGVERLVRTASAGE